jgi:hypothetical protein
VHGILLADFPPLNQTGEQFQAHRNRRSEEFLRSQFQRRVPIGGDKISREAFEDALTSIKAESLKGKDEILDEIFFEFDLDGDGQLNFDEFKEAMLRLSPLEMWCQRVPWWQDVADAIPTPNDQQDTLRALSQLTDVQIDAICAQASLGISVRLKDQAHKLRVAYKEMDAKAATHHTGCKFTTFKASAGTCDDYHRGLSGRVGALINAPIS